MLACGETDAMVITPAPMHDPAVSLASMAAWLSFTGIFHHNLLPHIPSTYLSAVNSNPHPGCSTIPKLQLPTAVLSRGPASLPGLCMAEARTVWFSFHLGCHRSAASLSALTVSPLTQTIALMWKSVSPPTKGKSSPTNIPVSPPSSFVLPSFVWFQILFSIGQVLLSALSWCSACTSVVWRCIPDISVEKDVLHIHPVLRHLVLLLWPSYFKLPPPDSPDQSISS